MNILVYFYFLTSFIIFIFPFYNFGCLLDSELHEHTNTVD